MFHYTLTVIMLKFARIGTRIGQTRRFIHNTSIHLNKSKDGSPVDENGLYYGRFSKEEYEKAAKFVKLQYENLASEIKGDTNIRENLAHMEAFPSINKTEGGIKTENLAQIFQETIKTTGPMTLSAYMRQCLTHPEFGYYTTRDPLDSIHGDFITSPEISSMFGEMIGIWLFSTWMNQNQPKSINLIEFGPGRGTLMNDCLTSFNKFTKQVNMTKNIILIEASSVLRNEQWKLLCGSSNSFETDKNGFNFSTTKWGDRIWWVDTEKDIELLNVEENTNYIVAHEFFDALPIKSFVKQESGWRELLVEHTASVKNNQQALPSSEGSESESDNELLNTEFHLTLSPKETPSSIIPTISSRFNKLPVDTRIEICPDAELFLAKILQLIKGDTGSVLIIDYGLASGIPENSLRGIYQHKFVSPFIKPGEVDLSVDVDFENLKLLLTKNNFDVFGPTEQGDWLHECGIGHRADQLIKSNASNYDTQEKIYNAYTRLTNKEDGMGKIYKFLCIMPKDSKTPVGFGGAV